MPVPLLCKTAAAVVKSFAETALKSHRAREHPLRHASDNCRRKTPLRQLSAHPQQKRRAASHTLPRPLKRRCHSFLRNLGNSNERQNVCRVGRKLHSKRNKSAARGRCPRAKAPLCIGPKRRKSFSPISSRAPKPSRCAGSPECSDQKPYFAIDTDRWLQALPAWRTLTFPL